MMLMILYTRLVFHIVHRTSMSCSGGTRGQCVVVVSRITRICCTRTPPFAPGGASMDARETRRCPVRRILSRGCSRRRLRHHRGANLEGGARREPVEELNAALLKLFSSWEGMHLRRETGEGWVSRGQRAGSENEENARRYSCWESTAGVIRKRVALVRARGSGRAGRATHPLASLLPFFFWFTNLLAGDMLESVGLRNLRRRDGTGASGREGVSALPRAERWRIRDGATTRGLPPTRCVGDPSARDIPRAYLASKVFFPTETGGTCAGMAFMSRCAMALGLSATGVWFSGDSACIGFVFRRDAGYVRAVAFGLGTSRTTSERRAWVLSGSWMPCVRSARRRVTKVAARRLGNRASRFVSRNSSAQISRGIRFAFSTRGAPRHRGGRCFYLHRSAPRLPGTPRARAHAASPHASSRVNPRRDDPRANSPDATRRRA